MKKMTGIDKSVLSGETVEGAIRYKVIVAEEIGLADKFGKYTLKASIGGVI